MAIAKSSFEVYDLGDGKYVRKEDVFYDSRDTFETKEDAQYEIFKNRVKGGIPVTNFKSSKYYKMYIDRARKENPELLV